MLDENQEKICWDIFKELGKKAINMSHYDLATLTEINDPQIWKQFLMTAEVTEFIREELLILQSTELKRLITDVSSNSSSVGRAQLINALDKTMSDTKKEGGDKFIYTYVPLNKDQLHADNVAVLDIDPFAKNA